MENNWWFNSNNEIQNSHNHTDDENDPFIIDYFLNYKTKRNYNSIKNEIVDKLYIDSNQ